MLASSRHFSSGKACTSRFKRAIGSTKFSATKCGPLETLTRPPVRRLATVGKKRRLKSGISQLLDTSILQQEGLTSSSGTTSRETRAHIPVMLEEVLHSLEVERGGLFVDATFGMGGHTRSILQHPKTRVIGVDRDSSILSRALEADADLKKWATTTDRLALIHGRFSNLASLLSACKGKVDGILMDIGVSSVQLDSAGRGFSYREELDAPLDMRMDQSDTNAPTAYDLVNSLSESKLADIIWKYGEDKRSRTIARTIVERRKVKPIKTTFELAQIVSENAPRGSGRYLYPGERIAEHSKRTFQALRIEVNQELAELQNGLVAAENLLRPGGRLAVITFHSLEDRIVKNFFAEASGKTPETGLSPEIAAVLPPPLVTSQPTFDSVMQRVSKPSTSELEENKRARPAKLRVGTRTSSPARS